jgi:hypothetical protein
MFIVGELTGIGMLVAPWAVVKLGRSNYKSLIELYQTVTFITYKYTK